MGRDQTPHFEDIPVVRRCLRTWCASSVGSSQAEFMTFEVGIYWKFLRVISCLAQILYKV